MEQVRIELGGSVVACGARTLLNHNKCEYDLDAVYFGHSNDVLDFNDVSVHTGRDTPVRDAHRRCADRECR